MSRIALCVILVAGVMIASLPSTVLATEAAPLTKAEVAHYAQMQATAVQNGVLANDGGMDEQTKWILIGGAVVVVVVALIVWA